MGRKPTPPPEPESRGSCLLGAAVFFVAGLALAWWWSSPWPIALGLPFILGALWRSWTRLLLLRARYRGIRGLLVTSSSPNWSEYIAKEWVPRLPTGFPVLNASEWQSWPRGLERGLHSAFVEASQNYCPTFLLLRGMREPLVFRFFYAFRDAKHGNREALDQLERRMFDELSKLDGADAG